MADDENDYPKTVEEAVDRLVAGLSDEDKEKIRGMPENDLIELHFGLGMGIRNRFGLWQKGSKLLDSCATTRGYEVNKDPDGTELPPIHPDDASGVIITALWERLQEG